MCTKYCLSQERTQKNNVISFTDLKLGHIHKYLVMLFLWLHYFITYQGSTAGSKRRGWHQLWHCFSLQYIWTFPLLSLLPFFFLHDFSLLDMCKVRRTPKYAVYNEWKSLIYLSNNMLFTYWCTPVSLAVVFSHFFIWKRLQEKGK